MLSQLSYPPAPVIFAYGGPAVKGEYASRRAFGAGSWSVRVFYYLMSQGTVNASFYPDQFTNLRVAGQEEYGLIALITSRA